MADIPFMRAHGEIPGPGQRPVLTGFFDGILGALPALAILWYSGALAAASRIVGLRLWLLSVLLLILLAGAGALYGSIFGRAANDREGGWLFGMSYGFIVWMLGPALLLQWIFHGPVVIGGSARALCAACLLYGIALGFLFPKVHSFLQRELD